MGFLFFGPVLKKKSGTIMSNFWGRFFHVFRGKKNVKLLLDTPFLILQSISLMSFFISSINSSTTEWPRKVWLKPIMLDGFNRNSKLGVISGFVGFTQFNPPKPDVSFSGYSPKIARRHNWYFVTKIVLTYCEKKIVFSYRKKLEIRGWRPRICKNFEITRAIYSNTFW